jgi:hypothetical protein
MTELVSIVEAAARQHPFVADINVLKLTRWRKKPKRIRLATSSTDAS